MTFPGFENWIFARNAFEERIEMFLSMTFLHERNHENLMTWRIVFPWLIVVDVMEFFVDDEVVNRANYSEWSFQVLRIISPQTAVGPPTFSSFPDFPHILATQFSQFFLHFFVPLKRSQTSNASKCSDTPIPYFGLFTPRTSASFVGMLFKWSKSPQIQLFVNLDKIIAFGKSFIENPIFKLGPKIERYTQTSFWCTSCSRNE